MKFDSILTDVIGLAVMIVGLVSLFESLLQVQLIGSSLPMVQGTVISLFAISFGGILLTRSATEAFNRLRAKCENGLVK
jgi:hypothetical protein